MCLNCMRRDACAHTAELFHPRVAHALALAAVPACCKRSCVVPPSAGALTHQGIWRTSILVDASMRAGRGQEARSQEHRGPHCDGPKAAVGRLHRTALCGAANRQLAREWLLWECKTMCPRRLDQEAGHCRSDQMLQNASGNGGLVHQMLAPCRSARGNATQRHPGPPTY